MTMTTAAGGDKQEGWDGGQIRALLLLVIVYAFNFIDRQIVGILAVPIKADLALSDSQLGLLGGLAFALFYSGLGIPVAMLADRRSRSWIMTIALLTWSAMTAACALANNFWQLFLARLGVGVGEAGGVAPAYSLIADLFPPGQRARALSVYSFGIPIGSALGIVFGGVIATLVDWRFAFLAVGFAGVLLAPIFRLAMREPERGAFDARTPGRPPPTVAVIARTLAAKPSFWLISLGASCCSMMGYGLFFWLPAFFVRSYNMSLLQASLFFGAMLLLGGLAGIWAGGWMGDRFGPAKRGRYLTIPALAFLLTLPFYLLGILAPLPALAFFVLLIPTALGLVWLGPVVTAIQHLVRADMRATTSALFLFIINLLGIGVGTWAIGALSDFLQLRFAADSLRYSILAGTCFYLLAAALFFAAARRLEADWQE
jgi:predicted MFS family arabinose efflux permease